jgi:hypothetical protein
MAAYLKDSPERSVSGDSTRDVVLAVAPLWKHGGGRVRRAHPPMGEGVDS